MNIELVLALIPEKMAIRGVKLYLTKTRHYDLQPLETRQINAFNQLYILLDDPQEIRIDSEFGYYDPLDRSCNEIIYEHEGAITLKNNTNEPVRVGFIQLIPTHA